MRTEKINDLEKIRFQEIKEYLKNKIDNDYNELSKYIYIEGCFINCDIIDDDHLQITWEEQGKKNNLIISNYREYTTRQLYNIWMEG